MNSDSNNGGKKRCKCKRSKCLKLYCDCFAAGWYCDETCSCKECFNTTEYEDTVEETRQLIESRNPNAFSSKIHCLEESPTSQIVEDGDQLKPIAGKHTKGCNCKKSMCQKKYCECYQANVGCCDQCRCLGCENKFGKKADFQVFNGSYHNHHNLTPTTPFQHFGHENEPSTTGKYILSSGSANSNMMLGTSTGSFNMVSLEQAYLNAFMNQFTPPDTTHFNARHLNSVMNILPMMALPNSSTPSGSYSSVRSWPGSLMGPVTVFGGAEVMKSTEKPNTGSQHDFTR